MNSGLARNGKQLGVYHRCLSYYSQYILHEMEFRNTVEHVNINVFEDDDIQAFQVYVNKKDFLFIFEDLRIFDSKKKSDQSPKKYS